MPRNFGPKTLKLKRGDIICKVKGGTSAVSCKDKREMYLLTNTYNPLALGHDGKQLQYFLGMNNKNSSYTLSS
jgi:hypothetical protein